MVYVLMRYVNCPALGVARFVWQNMQPDVSVVFPKCNILQTFVLTCLLFEQCSENLYATLESMIDWEASALFWWSLWEH